MLSNRLMVMGYAKDVRNMNSVWVHRGMISGIECRTNPDNSCVCYQHMGKNEHLFPSRTIRLVKVECIDSIYYCMIPTNQRYNIQPSNAKLVL